MAKNVIEIDGDNFDTLEGFFDEVAKKVNPDLRWGGNLDALSDILRGGFGTPNDGFVFRWAHSARSKKTLGFPATIRTLEEKVGRCHPSNRASVRADVESARRGEGRTLFEILVDIIRVHGPGGTEEEDGVELELA